MNILNFECLEKKCHRNFTMHVNIDFRLQLWSMQDKSLGFSIKYTCSVLKNNGPGPSFSLSSQNIAILPNLILLTLCAREQNN